MNEALKSNAPGDVVSSFYEAFDRLVKDGKVVAGTAAEYARAGNGVAVKAGAPKPDISTAGGLQAGDAQRQVDRPQPATAPARTTPSCSRSSASTTRSRTRSNSSRVGRSRRTVAAGEVEIGIQQTNVIQPFPGTQYLGPLPAELMEYGRFSLGVLTVSKEQEAAKAFIKFATSPEAAPLIRKSAMEPPAK